MSICKQCGVNKAGFMSDLCSACIGQYERPVPDGAPVGAVSKSESKVGPVSPPFKGSATICIGLGVLSLFIGLYFLFNPVADSSSVYGAISTQVVNLQKLTIGETFSIMGAVLLAAGLRPRR